ncbi:MAG: glycosyltransferase, partial [Desulfobacterales bacterium]|nr:glycosyltransferase [Desulfobacterales bacterium]
MKLLVVNYEYPPIGGGGGFVTRDIIENIAERGHGVTVITSHYNGLKKQETINGVDIIRVPVCCRKQMEAANLISMLSYLPSSIIKSIVD